MIMLAIMAALSIAEHAENKRRSREKDHSETLTKYSSGYDPYRNVFWELEQKFKINEDD